MLSYSFIISDSLAKIFFDTIPKQTDVTLQAFYQETVSFQVAYYSDYAGTDLCSDTLTFKVSAPEGIHVNCKKVISVPTNVACTGIFDEHYLSTKPGMFPDMLKPFTAENSDINLIQKAWRAVWIDIIPTSEFMGTNTEITIEAYTVHENNTKTCVWTGFVPLHIIPSQLPKQKLIHTEMFHADCLADYYNVKVFSDDHWNIIDNFMKTAVMHGINMIFTPLFTPPMDTAIGGERTTVQLVDITKIKNEYFFDFIKLKKWIELSLANGFEYIEMAPLFTQWGAQYAPKIVVTENGKETKLFGWHTKVADGKYIEFLGQFLQKLVIFLKELGVFEKVWFHVSDEPREGCLEDYKTAQEVMSQYLPDSPLFDACSDYILYTKGAVKKPVVANNHIQPYIDAHVKNLWTYYCVSQGLDVSNRFYSMPSYRNRIIGVQLYLYDIEGFLHWGYNFYNSRFSKRHLNPFAETDCDESFPGGDPYLVYPGDDKKPIGSIRLMVLYHALQDLRAFRLLESLTNRDYVENIIKKYAKMTVTFKQYPHNSDFIIKLRHCINNEIQKRL